MQPTGIPTTSIEVQLFPNDFEVTEIVIEFMQMKNRDLSIDDCINKIFTAGLARMADQITHPEHKS